MKKDLKRINIQFFAEDPEKNKQEDKKVEENQDESTVNLTKEELAERYNNKFAEGARKAEKSILEELGVKSLDELKSKVGVKSTEDVNEKHEASNNDNTDVEEMKKEIATLKALNACNELSVKKEFQEDVLSIIRGKGLEVTEENIKATVEKHPHFIQKKDEGQSGVNKLGGTNGENKPQPVSELEQARKIFGLK